MLKISLALTLALSTFAAHGQALDGAIRNLAKAATELDAAATNEKDTQLQGAIGDLKRKVEDIWTQSMLAPLQVLDKKISELGYDWNRTNEFSMDFHLVQNDQWPKLNNASQALKSEDWKRLSHLADLEVRQVKSISRLADDPNSTSSISNSRVQAARVFADSSRIAGLNSLKDTADRNIACVDYFSQAFTNYGLVPVLQNSAYQWSAVDLMSVYNIPSLADAGADLKAKILPRLEELLRHGQQYLRTCVSVDEFNFLKNERDQLKGN